jgi:membrane protein DedA with SNARE-associated domain
MSKDQSRSSKLLAVGVVTAWTCIAWWMVIFTAGWAGSLSNVLLNRNGDHLWATLVVWVIALSPLVGWWLLLTKRLKRF